MIQWIVSRQNGDCIRALNTTLHLNKSMQLIFSPLIKEFLAIWGPKIYYLAHNIPPPDPALNLINPVLRWLKMVENKWYNLRK